MPTVTMAFDFSNRTIDADGRMHVAVSNISKATVNPYKGTEIPNWETLGLDPKRVYRLLRDPQELAKAAPSFNKIQLLQRHVPVNADEPGKEITVGATGESAVFDAPYLKNSLVIWDAAAIAGVTSGQQRELSCCYRYDADMTPGAYDGLTYDGIMRNIRGNHVALVEVGRAGSDVLVGDSRMETRNMTIKAQAAKIRAIIEAKSGGFAADSEASELVEKVEELLDHVQDLPDEDEEEANDARKGKDESDEDETEEEKKKREAKEAADRKKARDAKAAKDKAAKDKDTEEAEDRRRAKDRGKASDATPAMDADTIAAKVRADLTAQFNARDEAKDAVRPYVGVVHGMDTGEEVLRHALKTLGVKIEGVHPSAYRAILDAQPKPGATVTRLAADSGAGSDFAKRFPQAARVAA